MDKPEVKLISRFLAFMGSLFPMGQHPQPRFLLEENREFQSLREMETSRINGCSAREREKGPGQALLGWDREPSVRSSEPECSCRCGMPQEAA